MSNNSKPAPSKTENGGSQQTQQQVAQQILSNEQIKEPILPKQRNQTKKKRYDKLGVRIQKGERKHHIYFSNPIEQVRVIENWKKYNAFEDIKEEHTCPCQLI